jgi:hypothetical protein
LKLQRKFVADAVADEIFVAQRKPQIALAKPEFEHKADESSSGTLPPEIAAEERPMAVASEMVIAITLPVCLTGYRTSRNAVEIMSK